MNSTLLGEIGTERFLQEYWQQKPLLIRQALANYQCPVSPEELAGLALEDDVVSRLIRETGKQPGWQVRHGPIDEQTFLQLPEQRWTLLVQEVDRHVDEIAALLQHFDFLPRWRIDDIMISYAADQGSVGPHVDQYDVFLLQGMGQRRWQLDQQTTSRDHIEGLELAILEQFTVTDDWTLDPGDMLYLPAGIPHHGVAQGPCMTVSIGCRAPDQRELLEGVLEQALLDSDYPRQRYRDDASHFSDQPGELNQAMRQSLRQLLLEPLQDDKQLDQLIARYLTQASRVQMHIYPEDELDKKQFLQYWTQQPLRVSTHLRALYYIDELIHIVIDGINYSLSQESLPAITALLDQGLLSWQSIWQHDRQLCQFLYQTYAEGQLEFVHD